MNKSADNPPISVVIPARNEETFLSKALTGLLCQQDLPAEVIVVDNNSTDRTKLIARTFAGKFRTAHVAYRVVTETKLGSAYARNTGFTIAKSPIIASLDADTVPHPTWIRNIREHFRRFDSVAVSGITVIKDSSLFVRIMSELKRIRSWIIISNNFKKLKSGTVLPNGQGI